MEVIHALDNGEKENTITYVILKRESTKELMIAYSGTKDAAQLVTEALEAFPISYSIHSEVKGALVVDYFYKHYLNGFRDDLMKNMPGILAQYPDYDIIFTGHSLGGSLTVHGAADFILNGWGVNRKVTIITFGQPRVGNPAFNDAFKSLTAGWYRLDHNKDIVPHVPPCIPGIEVSCEHDGLLPFYPYHAAQEIFYDDPFENYIACSPTDGEDKKCSDGHVNDSTTDHTYYFGVAISELNGQTSPKKETSMNLK